jgi:hypothetical protein
VEAIANSLAQYGPIGTVCALLVWLYLRKEKELTRKDAELAAERAARIADVKSYTDLCLGLQKGVSDNVTKLSDMFEAVQKTGGLRR